jgi:hypothetical protein
MGDKEKDDKPDMAWKVLGALIALGTGFAVRKAIEAGWQKTTGKKPPQDPHSLDISTGEAVAYAVVLGVGMEVARIITTRTAAKKWRAWRAATPPTTTATPSRKVKDAVH